MICAALRRLDFLKSMIALSWLGAGLALLPASLFAQEKSIPE